MILRIRFVMSLFITFFIIGCIDTQTIRPKTARDYYEKGLNQITSKDYSNALDTFDKCIAIADPVADEYYMSMCYFEIAFTYNLSNKKQDALKYIEILLSQVISSKEPRILAENLRSKIVNNIGYQNASF